jgi:hypothetical protein
MPNEEKVFGIKNLHSIKSTLKSSQTDVTILSDYVRDKYANALDFLNVEGNRIYGKTL